MTSFDFVPFLDPSHHWGCFRLPVHQRFSTTDRLRQRVMKLPSNNSTLSYNLRCFKYSMCTHVFIITISMIVNQQTCDWVKETLKYCTEFRSTHTVSWLCEWLQISELINGTVYMKVFYNEKIYNNPASTVICITSYNNFQYFY